MAGADWWHEYLPPSLSLQEACDLPLTVPVQTCPAPVGGSPYVQCSAGRADLAVGGYSARSPLPERSLSRQTVVENQARTP
jgi:hypothetical protein